MKSRISTKSIASIGIAISVIVLVCLVIMSCYFYFSHSSSNNKQTDALKFKEEHEALNNQIIEGMTKEYLSISIPKDNPIKYSNFSEVFDIIKEGTGVIYFGFPECPWCRNIVPILLDAAKEVGIDKIYYLNAREDRDQKSLDENGNIVVDNEGTKEYQELISLLYDSLSSYNGLGDDTIKRLYFPTVVFVKDGNVLSVHEGSVESQQDPYIALTKDQSDELKSTYEKMIKNIIACDDLC